jgi:hypothetical protein
MKISALEHRWLQKSPKLVASLGQQKVPDPFVQGIDNSVWVVLGAVQQSYRGAREGHKSEDSRNDGDTRKIIFGHEFQGLEHPKCSLECGS